MSEILRPRQVATMLGIAKQTLAHWRMRGAGPKFLRLGRAVGYRRSDIDVWLQGRERSSTSDPGDAGSGEGRAS